MSPTALQATRRYIAYLRNDRELLARAYAQYIATRSGSPMLRNQIDHFLSLPPDRAERYIHWDHTDFSPIAVAFDQMFSKKGWR